MIQTMSVVDIEQLKINRTIHGKALDFPFCLEVELDLPVFVPVAFPDTF